MSGSRRRPGKWDAVAAQVIEDYRAELPMAEIAKRNGIPPGSLPWFLKRHGVERRGVLRAPSVGVVRQPSKWDAIAPELIEDYRAGVSLPGIAERHGIPYGSVSLILSRHGVKRDRYKPRRVREVSPEEVIGLYVVEGLTTAAVAERLDINRGTVSRVLHRHVPEYVRPPGHRGHSSAAAEQKGS